MKRSMKKILTFALLAVVAIAATVYFFVIPFVLSLQYTGRVHAAAQPLESNFKDIGESVDLLRELGPETPDDKKKKDIEYIMKLIQTGQQEIMKLEAAGNTFAPPPYSELSGQYEKVTALKEHTKRLVDQSREVLADYQKLATYLDTFGAAITDVSTELSDFNSTIDINVYANRSAYVGQVARKLRENASLLSALSPPNDMKEVNAGAIRVINEAANGFDDLAYGLLIPADDPIYAAARRIEAATVELDAIKGTMYDHSLEQSRVIKNVLDLDEKLDLVLGS